MKPVDLPRVEYDLIELKGGYDLLTPTLKLPAGALRESLNFEVSINGGYTRIPGYERFDGRPSPSAANFSSIELDAVANLTVGQVITGPTGSATVIAISGTVLIYTKVSGAFALGDAILQGANPVGTVVSLGAMLGARQSAIYRKLASDAYRADIGVVPGSGSIRGVAAIGSTVYAWRNNAGGTAMEIYRSSGTGWTLVPLGVELAFNDGDNEILAGQTVTGQTSGASGVVIRVAVREGTWGASDAEGSLIFASVTGTFLAGEDLLVSAVPRAKAVAAQAAITLAPNGRVQTVTGNFGSLYSTRIYGCDNVNPGFEFDGTTYVPIRTGMPSDAPTNVAVHSGHLFFTFAASLQFSGINEPYRWSPIFGAGEIAMRDTITAIMSLQGGDTSPALVVYSLNETNVLYGTNSQDFVLTPHSVSMGANRYTAQRLEMAYVFDDRGVSSMATSDKFGNFDSATLTYNIRPVVQARRTLSTAAGINREKSQYRVFFSDGYALFLTIVNGKYLGASPVQMPNPVTCWCEGERADRTEQSYFGSNNGYVYRMDVGTSFDGAPITFSLLTNYNPTKSPRLRKRYRRASLEMTGSDYAEFQFGYELGYGLPDHEQPIDEEYETRFSPAYWDTFTWDDFTWDGKVLAPSEVEMTGTAENVAVRIFGEYDYVGEFTLNSLILHYTIRRGLR